MGFYTAFGGYLDGNLSILEDLKDEGYDSPDVSHRLFQVDVDMIQVQRRQCALDVL